MANVKQLQGQPVCFSPDGKLILTKDSAVMMWSTETGEMLWRQYPFKNTSSAIFLPDSSCVAVANTTGEVVLISSTSGEIRSHLKHSILENETGTGSDIQVHDDGKSLISVCSAGEYDAQIVRTWDGIRTFAEYFERQTIGQALRHPDGSVWFVHNAKHDAPRTIPRRRLVGRTWPFARGVYHEIELPWSSRSFVAFSPGGTCLLTAERHPKSEIAIYDFPSLKRTSAVTLDEELAWGDCSVSYAPCGTRITACVKGAILLFNASDLSLVSRFSNPHAETVLFCPGKSLFAVGNNTGTEVRRMADMGLDESCVTRNAVNTVCAPKAHPVPPLRSRLPPRIPAISHSTIGMIHPIIYGGWVRSWLSDPIQLEPGRFCTQFEFEVEPSPAQLQLVAGFIEKWSATKTKFAKAIFEAYNAEIRSVYAPELDHPGYCPILRLSDLPEITKEDKVWDIVVSMGRWHVRENGTWQVEFWNTFDGNQMLRIAENKGELSVWTE